LGGAAALIACGGDESSPQVLTVDPSSVRKPGAVVYYSDNWKLADESKEAVAGGIWPDNETSDLGASWDPYITTSSVNDAFNDTAYEYPFRYNRGPGIAPGSPEYYMSTPNLAESWELANDGTTYTWTIRQGVKFHPIAPVNGRVMDIDDWKTTIERFMALGTNRLPLVDSVDKFEFPDNRHVIIRMKEPYAAFMTRMLSRDYGFKIVPKELNREPELLHTKQIGTNYRIVDKVQPSVSREFRRFDDYWAGKPYIDRWHYPIIPEAANRYAQFLAKNIISHTPANREVLQMRKDSPDSIMGTNELIPFAIPYASFGKPESTTAPWKDSRVRIALHKAIDFDSILAFQSNRDAFQAAGIEIETSHTTHSPRILSFWLDPRKGELGEASKNYLYDVAEAKKLVEAAGYPNGFEIPMNAQVGGNEEAIRLQVDYYKKSGFIEVKENWMQRLDYFENVVYNPNLKGMNGTSSGAGSANDPEHVLFNLYYSKGRQACWSDPKMDEIILRQRREFDAQKRGEIIKEWQKYIAKEFYVLPRRHTFASWTFWHPWVHNFNYLDFENQTGGEKLWLDPGMPRRNGV
jgi:peptide/nickel transport system substrate-binding protein